VFDPELEKNAGALGYAIRWQQAAPAYLIWANARQEQGWTYAAGEYVMEASLELANGRSILLHGRIDRVDENAQGERAVLDYKTTDVEVLRRRMKDKEDHQLAFYGLLSSATVPVQTAHYVALEIKNGKTGDLPATHYEEWQGALRERIIVTLSAISEGAALPASGINTSCRFCDMRGLCRKGVW
jgi:ATP-dependent helicase/nuclease subunit B